MLALMHAAAPAESGPSLEARPRTPSSLVPTAAPARIESETRRARFGRMAPAEDEPAAGCRPPVLAEPHLASGTTRRPIEATRLQVRRDSSPAATGVSADLDSEKCSVSAMDFDDVVVAMTFWGYVVSLVETELDADVDLGTARS